MRSMEKYLALLLAMCMMACSVGTFTVSAMEATSSDVIVDKTDMEENELQPMMANACEPDTYGDYVWKSIDEALKYYRMPEDRVYPCNVWYNDIHYTYYVQMDSYRIYVRLA